MKDNERQVKIKINWYIPIQIALILAKCFKLTTWSWWIIFLPTELLLGIPTLIVLICIFIGILRGLIWGK